MKKIVIVGSIAYDEIMDFPGEFVDYIDPNKLHQLNVSFIIDTLEKQIGGTAANIAYNLNFLVKGAANILGAVGKDGATIIEWMKEQKISQDGVWTDEGLYTSTGRVITDKNNNQIWGFYQGAGASLAKKKLAEFIQKGDVVVLSATSADSFVHVQKYLIENKIDYLYDPGMMLTGLPADDLKNGALHAKWIVANDYEMGRLWKVTGLNADDLIAQGASIITTLGDKGVHYADKEDVIEVPAFEVLNPTDPTGAGDAFRGAFLAALVQKKSMSDALVMANAMASFAVEKYGTVQHAPSNQDFESRMKIIEKGLVKV